MENTTFNTRGRINDDMIVTCVWTHPRTGTTAVKSMSLIDYIAWKAADAIFTAKFDESTPMDIGVDQLVLSAGDVGDAVGDIVNPTTRHDGVIDDLKKYLAENLTEKVDLTNKAQVDGIIRRAQDWLARCSVTCDPYVSLTGQIVNAAGHQEKIDWHVSLSTALTVKHMKIPVKRTRLEIDPQGFEINAIPAGSYDCLVLERHAAEHIKVFNRTKALIDGILKKFEPDIPEQFIKKNLDEIKDRVAVI